MIYDTLSEDTHKASELTPLQKLDRSILSAVKSDEKSVSFGLKILDCYYNSQCYLNSQLMASECEFKVLTWLHPGVNVVDKTGGKVPGVAIKSTTIDGFASVSHTVSSQWLFTSFALIL